MNTFLAVHLIIGLYNMFGIACVAYLDGLGLCSGKKWGRRNAYLIMIMALTSWEILIPLCLLAKRFEKPKLSCALAPDIVKSIHLS